MQTAVWTTLIPGILKLMVLKYDGMSLISEIEIFYLYEPMEYHQIPKITSVLLDESKSMISHHGEYYE